MEAGYRQNGERQINPPARSVHNAREDRAQQIKSGSDRPRRFRTRTQHFRSDGDGAPRAAFTAPRFGETIAPMDGESLGRGAMDAPEAMRGQGKRIAFFAIAAFILLSPALPQLFGVQAKIFRPWVMYSAVGVGLLKGEFTVEHPDGTTATFVPREVFGYNRYPLEMTFHQRHIVLKPEHLDRAAAPFCETMPEGATLSYDGLVATFNGWEPLSRDSLCAGEPD